MKIGLVSPYDFAVPSGVNKHVCHLADNYARLGHDVRIIGPASRHQGLDRDNLIVIGENPVGLPGGGSVAHVTFSISLSRQVQQVLARERFDVVHTHEPFMPLLPFQFLRHSQALNIATFHAAQDEGRRWYAYFRPAVAYWWPRLHGKIAVSPAAQRLISRHFPDRYEIIPNGVDYPEFAAPVAPLEQYKDGKLNILFLGRLEKRKGLPYLLEAFSLLKARMPDTRLIIVGRDGGMQGVCESFVRRARLKDVVFAGYARDEDLPRYYHTADVFCAPNTGNESFGLILLEAMAAGTPVVASGIEGFAYVVAHGEEGLLVPPRDSAALAEALLQLLSDPDRCREMSRAGQIKAERFSWEKISQQVLSFYERGKLERAAARGLAP
jgi:phosphatidylinositol alpha-mannosyltransferase